MSTSEPRYHHGDLPAVLLESALALLAEGGADALSLRAVARRAGVSPMAPYRHYADKEHLLAAVATHGFDGLRQVLQAADDSCPPSEALSAQAVAYVQYALEHPALFRLMFGPVRPAGHPALHAAGETAYGVLAGRVRPSGEKDARVLGSWALVHGLAMLFLDGRVKGGSDGSAAAITQAVADAMMRG